MMSVARLGLLCVILLSVAIGCQQTNRPVEVTVTPVSYQELCGLTQDRFGAMGEQDVRQWLHDKPGIVLDSFVQDLPEEQKNSEVIGLPWERPEQTQLLSVAYLRDGRLIRVSLPEVKNGPTLRQVIAGLGQPEMLYRSVQLYEQALYSVGLEYPSLGISVSTRGLEDVTKVLRDKKLIIPLNLDMPIDKIECYKAGPIDEVLRDAFFASNESLAYWQKGLVPWPGSDASEVQISDP